MQKIRVPQGQAAVLTKKSLELKIDGLFTDSFSSCNILVAIGAERIVMIHADVGTDLKQIKELLSTDGQSLSIQLIYRIKEGDYFHRILTQELGEEFKLTHHAIELNTDGIMVSFNCDTPSNLHPNIQTFPKNNTPKLLLRHPNEQQYLSVRKSEQLIGLAERYRSKKIRPTHHLTLFDGECWIPFHQSNLQINLQGRTSEEMQWINKEDAIGEVCGKLAGIAYNNQGMGIPFLEEIRPMVPNIAFWLCGYLNDFDAEQLFKRDIDELIDHSNSHNIFRMAETNNDEKSFCTMLLHYVRTPQSNHETINQRANIFIEKSPETAFIKRFKWEMEGLNKHFQQRKLYTDYRELANEKINQTKQQSQTAINHYKNTDFTSAFKALNEVLICLHYYCLANNTDLATTYYNIGRAAHQLNEYELASSYLERSLMLRQRYQPKRSELIKKTSQALEEAKHGAQEKNSALLKK